MNLPVHHHLNTTLLAVPGQGDVACIQQIRRSLGPWLCCRAHRTGQHQWCVVGPKVIEKRCRFFECVGALGQHDTHGALLDLELRPQQYSQ
ncbi:hypothetical protein D3C79_992810 [compost metagenome]